MDATLITQINADLAANMATAVGIVTVAGLALINLAFLGFILRKGKQAASGKVPR